MPVAYKTDTELTSGLQLSEQYPQYLVISTLAETVQLREALVHHW